MTGAIVRCKEAMNQINWEERMKHEGANDEEKNICCSSGYC